MRVTYEELHGVLRGVLTHRGFDSGRADLCARLFADASRDGVPSHGLNLFPRFARMIGTGVVDVEARPVRVAAYGAVERWDGRRGAGALNAHHAMGRAIALARDHGIGCAALSNTNHWGRGGNFGWQAADAGAIGICWTTTLPNLPPWGAADPRIGNNPLVIAVPRPDGHVVLDMALSQFSYGALASYRMRGEALPVAGGFDLEGRLTQDPAAIEASRRPLPIGFWKGSGLSIVLDLVAAIASGGRAVHEVEMDPEQETGLSQMFVALDVASCGDAAAAARLADRVVEHLHGPGRAGESVRYPGERTLETRRRNMEEGIPVDKSIWQIVQRL